MEKVNVLLIGSGGREHALAWKIAQSPLLGKLFTTPGNPGTAQCGENVSVDVSDFKAVADFCALMNIGLIVVGPEQPLVDGIADYMAEKKIPVFGPKKLAAQLEGSKSFAKQIMQKYGVPTAGYQTFSLSDADNIRTFINESETFPIVLKADGLAAGKGVFIPKTKTEALENLETILADSGLSSAAETLVIEEFMQGEEASIFAICDGENFVTLTAAQDHKRIGEGDTGPNTGGMGAYTPAPVATSEILKQVDEEVIAPTLKGMVKEGCAYVGVLYVGLMIAENKAKVVEFNCRFGDPECQIILPKLKTDLLGLMLNAAKGELKTSILEFHPEYYTCVVLASEGYPGSYQKGIQISGMDKAAESHLVFHAGTKNDVQNGLVTNGGRVLSVIGKGTDLNSSIKDAYEGVDKITFNGAYHRRDIGKKGLVYFQ